VGPADRTPWWVVDGLADAVAVAGGHGDVLVVDIENTLVGYGSTREQRHAAMAAAVEAAAADGRLRRLAFISNARHGLPALTHASLAIVALTGARKPYVWLPPLRRIRAELAGAAVYGDQPLTDGLLARYLGGIWLQPRHVDTAAASEPWWPRVMRAAGRRTAQRRFRPGAPGPSPAA